MYRRMRYAELRHNLDGISETKLAGALKELLQRRLSLPDAQTLAFVPWGRDDSIIHANTPKYRLKRIQELLGVDLHDPNIRFRLRMAVTIAWYLER